MAGSEQAPSRSGLCRSKSRGGPRAAAPGAGQRSHAEKRAVDPAKDSTADVGAGAPAAVMPPPAPHVARPTAPSLTMLTVEDLVRLLRIMGSAAASAELVRADIEAGAPTNADGSINFVHYAAWLERLGG